MVAIVQPLILHILDFEHLNSQAFRHSADKTCNITVKFDIQVDNRTIAQSTPLHDDIPGYNLLTLEFMLPPLNDDEDLILEEENPEIYAHLENVLVDVIDAHDIAIFKSQKDHVRNKQNLFEYICYAQMWQVLLVIFSYVTFTCDIILVITLIIFFIKY